MHDRKPRYLGLGSATSVSLAKARTLAADARQRPQIGLDSIEVRRQSEVEAAADKARSMTFKECAEAYMAAHEPSLKNAKHCEQWHGTIRRFPYPKFGGVAVTSVTTETVLDAIQPIWHSMPETASRVRGRIEVVIEGGKGAWRLEGAAAPSNISMLKLLRRMKRRELPVHGFRSIFFATGPQS
jgi:hypothetical protein